LDGIANWQLIEQTPGLRIMRRRNGNLVVLSARDIEAIQRIELALRDSAVAQEQGIPFKVGDLVRLASGLWDHLDKPVKITQIEDRNHIWLELPPFSKIVVPISEIEAA
jgi:transcription antitermination factor NusG